MVGIVGYTKFNYVPDNNTLHNMLKTIVTNEYQDFKTIKEPIIDIGISFLKSINSFHISSDTTSGWSALLYGWIYNSECIERQNHAECLLQAWLRYGINGLRVLSGSFCGILWNNNKREVVLITDKFSTRPIYYAIKDHELIFSTHARAILQVPGFQKRINELAIVKFLMYGQIILGDDTFFYGVKVLPPASTLICAEDGCTINQYWDLEFKENRNFNVKRYASILAKTFSRKVEALVNRFNNNTVVLLLSGGLDSRSILAALDSISRARVLAVTFGVSGCTDIKIATKLTSKLRVKHHIITYNPEEITRYVWYYVWITEGRSPISISYLPHVLREITILHNSGVVFQGFALDNLLGGLFLKDHYFKIKHISDFVRLLEEDWKLFSANELKCVLGPRLRNMVNEARKEFIKTVLKCKSDSYPNKANYFSARTRLRWVSLGSIVIREFMEEVLPGIADDIVEIIEKIPATERRRYKFYREFLLRLSTDASKIPYANTLVPPILPHKLWRPISALFFVIDKIMKKLSQGRATLFISYFDFDKVLRESREWRNVLWDLLVREDALVYKFGYLNRHCVLRIIRDHLKGKNYGLKLAYLMTLEIFLRMFFSGIAHSSDNL